nr:hypothetical protein Ade03nite_25390 [Actinoplanes derwentensis]
MHQQPAALTNAIVVPETQMSDTKTGRTSGATVKATLTGA